MNAVANFLRDRSPGERAVLAGVAAVVAIALVVAFVWLPLERTRARVKAQLPVLRASIATLEREAAEAKRLRAMPVVNANAAASPASLRALPGAQVSVLDAKTVAVSGGDISFGALLEWLAAAQSAQGLRVESARVDALPAAGRVRAELRLSRP